MKEFICKKDYYIEDTKFASEGDHVVLLQDGCTVKNNNNGSTVICHVPFVYDKAYFSFMFEVDKPSDKNEFDTVNNPQHYTNGGIECIDAMIAAYGKEAVMHFCQCNAFKYQWRFDKKNGVEDLKKAEWYNNKYIELKNGN